MNRPTAIYSAAQVRALDAWEIEKRRVPGFTLMTRAAEGALKILRARWPQAKRVAVVCGAGNNGGDGYVLARLARLAGLEALVLAAAPPDKLGGDARRAMEEWLATGGSAHPFVADALSGSDVIVDGLLGIGLAGAPRAETLAVIRAINAAKRPVLALDIPSGVNADTGAVSRSRGVRRSHGEFRGAEVRAVPRRGPGARGRRAARRPGRGGAARAAIHAAHAAHR